MTAKPRPDQASLVSTGVVSRLLGLDQNAIRAMIELGTLPQPQWVSLGNRVERAYTQEWLILALDQLHDQQLAPRTALRSPFVPEGSWQFVIRFDSDEWTLAETVRTLAATDALWRLCNEAVGVAPEDVEDVRIRRMVSGSPLDVLVQAVAAGVGVPVGLGLLVYVIKHAEDLSGALPGFLAAWNEGWARHTRSRTDCARAKLEAAEFEVEARRRLDQMKVTPSASDIAAHDPQPLALHTVEESRPRAMFVGNGAEPRALDSSAAAPDEADETTDGERDHE